MNGWKFDPARAFRFLAGEWAKVEECFRRADDIPPDMPTETPTEAHLRNEVKRLLRVCLDAIARWESADGGKRERTPETPEERRKQTLYVALRSLRQGRGMTVSKVVEYLATPDGRDLSELVQEELHRHPQKRGRGGKPAKKRTARDVIKAAFKATYPSGRPTRG